MNKAILVQADDWEGLYIDGKLVEEGHTLNEGKSRIRYFFKLAEQYDFNLKNMGEIYLNNHDITWTEDTGSFPKDIMEFDTIKDYKF